MGVLRRTVIMNLTYSTFQKIFTIIRIFLKSEAPKALYSSHSFIVSLLLPSGKNQINLRYLLEYLDIKSKLNYSLGLFFS